MDTNARSHNPRNDDYQLREQPDRSETDHGLLVSHISDLADEIEHAGLNASRELHAAISVLNELLGEAYLAKAGVPYEKHSNDCAIKQAPAYRPGPCDCGASAVTADRA